MTDAGSTPAPPPAWRPGTPAPASLSAHVQSLALATAQGATDQLAGLFQRFRSNGGGAKGGHPRAHPGRPAPFAVHRGAGPRGLLAWVDDLSATVRDARTVLAERSGSALRLPDAAPGGRASVRLWLHNTTSGPARDLRLWSPGLFNDAGGMLPGEAMSFTPEVVESLEPGQSREVLVVLRVPPGLAGGTYGGQILVENLHHGSFPLVLRIVPGHGGLRGGAADEPAASLGRYGVLVAGELRRYLETDEPAEYLTHLLADYPGRSGKGLRPSLCLATCEAFGGMPGDALPSAVAIELLHNAFLVHDDIEDQSKLRRGEDTLHVRYGTALALNAGDGLALLSVAALRENSERLGPRLAEKVMLEFDFMSRQTVAGQALELGWRRDNRLDLEPEDYLNLVMKKTCWYTTVLPLRIGAIAGSRGSADPEAMIAFGLHLGAAFQIRDDILNLVGDEALYGKEPLGDLIEGKRTLVLIHLLAAATPKDGQWVRAYLGRPVAERTHPEAAHLFQLMLSHGSVDFASEFAAGIAQRAHADMDYAFAGLPDTPAKRFVASLVPYMINRPL